MIAMCGVICGIELHHSIRPRKFSRKHSLSPMLLRNHFIEAVPARLQQLNYVIIFVSDMQRSVAFYRDLLGLPLKFSSPERTEFVTSTTTLARHPARSTSQGDQAAAAAGQ